MSNRTPTPADDGGDHVSRIAAFLSINLFSIRGLVARLRGERELWPATIASAELPPAVAESIVAIVRRTGLWNRERIEVGRELCAHAADALRAGRDAEDIAASMGDARKVARLIRRSMKRKRPLLWQVRAWMARAVGACAGAVVLTAGLMAVRFFVGSPAITRNFIAELNMPIEALEEGERAWPILQEAWATLGPKEEIAKNAMDARADAYAFEFGDTDDFVESHAMTGIGLLPLVPADHPDAEAVRSVYDDLQVEIALLHEAAAKPRLGMLLSSKWPELPEALRNTPEEHGWLPDPIPESDDPAEQEWVISILLPALGPQRAASKWLGYDALVKIGEGDPDGALDSVDAMLGLADQTQHDHFLIGYLVGLAIEHLASNTVSEMMTAHRDTLDEYHLARLAHMFGEPRFERVPLEGEEMMFADFLQRTFTDDGSGDGYLTNEGVELLSSMEWFSSQYADTFGKAAEEISSIAFIGSRAEQQRMADKIYAQLRVQEAAGYRIYRDVPLASGAMIESLDRVRYRPLRIMLPALGHVTLQKQERRARVEALLVGIASELYRRETGGWPSVVEDLHPRYLPFIPEDPATGDPIAIRPGEQTVVVYALGPDGDDDGGIMDPDDERMMRPKPVSAFVEQPGGRILIAPPIAPGPDTPDGDWVLFPSGP